MSELEAQANRGKEMGFKGLEELKELSDMAKRGEITLEFTGKRPSLEQIKLASGGEIDAMIRGIAIENNALFHHKRQGAIGSRAGQRIKC